MWPPWYFETSNHIQEQETAPFFSRHFDRPCPCLDHYHPSFLHTCQNSHPCVLVDDRPYHDSDFETSIVTCPEYADDHDPDYCFCYDADSHVYLDPYFRRWFHDHRRSHSAEHQRTGQEQTPLLPPVPPSLGVEGEVAAVLGPALWSSMPGE